jgi:hypothetical protein
LQEGNRYGVEHHVAFQVLLVHHLVLEEHHAKPLPRYRSQVLSASFAHHLFEVMLEQALETLATEALLCGCL